MNQTTYFDLKFLEFQIMCYGPQITPSQVACGSRAWDWDPCTSLCYTHSL